MVPSLLPFHAILHSAVLFLAFDIFHNITDFAIKNSAKHFYRMGTNTFIPF